VGDVDEEGTDLPRLDLSLLPVARRKGCFAEVELCPTEQQAMAEAHRCARCDLEFTQPH